MSGTVDSSAPGAAADGPVAAAAPASAPAPAPVPPAPEPASPVLEEMELHLLTINECFVYAVPRLATATGYRAEDWGLAHPLVTGALKCYRRGDDRLFLRIYASPPPPPPSSSSQLGPGDGKDGGSGGGGGDGRPRTPRLFAEAPIYLGKGPKGEPPAPLEASFVPVTDSSRYFVIKVVDPSVSASGASRARHAFLGIGFREREDAFALKACVQDFVAYHERMVRAEQLHEEDQRAWRQQEEEEQGQKHDAHSGDDAALPPELHTRVAALGLKEGQKLRISLGHAMEGAGGGGGSSSSSSSKHRHTPTLSASSPGVAAIDAPLLPPPPGDRSPAPAPMKGMAPTPVAAAAQQQPAARGEGEGGGEGEEEWGDFEVA